MKLKKRSFMDDAVTNFGATFLAPICLLSLVSLSSCGADADGTSPPTLSTCTRFEVRYHPSMLKYFFPISDLDLPSILSEEERRHLDSLEILVVTNKEQIKAFADSVSRGVYVGRSRGSPAYLTPVDVTCYRDNDRLAFFTVLTDLIITDDGRRFKYPRGLPDLQIVESAELRSLRLRSECAYNLFWLRTAGSPAHRRLRGDLFDRNAKMYPAPDGWCDAVIRVWRDEHSIDAQNAAKRAQSEQWMSNHFLCPSVRGRVSDEMRTGSGYEEGHRGALRCHYAMNPLCTPASAADTVLLFETKVGWNQHGGPELFTFDNHDPKGGLVLLNDGTVKFIRTEEELKELRWK